MTDKPKWPTHGELDWWDEQGHHTRIFDNDHVRVYLDGELVYEGPGERP